MSALSSMAMDGVKRVPGGASGKVVEMGGGKERTLLFLCAERPSYHAGAVPFAIHHLKHLSDI